MDEEEMEQGDEEEIELCGRTVTRELLPEDSGFVCSDCGMPALYLMTELCGDTWYHCGMCEVGG